MFCKQQIYYLLFSLEKKVASTSDTSENTDILHLIYQESLLRKLEDNVESEMDNWQKIVERTQRELKEVFSMLCLHSSLYFTLVNDFALALVWVCSC